MRRKGQPKNGNHPSKSQSGQSTWNNKKAEKYSKKVNRNDNKSHGSFKSKVKFLLKILGVIIMIILLTNLMNGRSKSRVSKVSDLLRENVAVGLMLLEYEAQLSKFLNEDSLGDFIKTQVRPILDRISSLRTQVKQNEKLGHVPGGPSTFIHYALRELDGLEWEQLVYIEQETSKIITRNGNMALSFIEVDRKVTRALNQLSSKQVDPDLLKSHYEFGIHFDIGSWTREETLKGFEDGSIGLEAVLKEATTLADLHDEFEELVERISETCDDPGSGYSDLQWLRDWVKEESALRGLEALAAADDDDPVRVCEMALTLAKNIIQKLISIALLDFHLDLTQPLLHKVHSNLSGLIKGLGRQFEGDLRGQAITLTRMARKDIESLRIRIENLRYGFAKKNFVDLPGS